MSSSSTTTTRSSTTSSSTWVSCAEPLVHRRDALTLDEIVASIPTPC
ncbi:MAG: hypothetical protein R2726_10690 [Acidimicrobiales bacterium]